MHIHVTFSSTDSNPLFIQNVFSSLRTCTMMQISFTFIFSSLGKHSKHSTDSCKLSSQPMSQHSTRLLPASYHSSSNRCRWDESSASGSHLCLRPSQSLLHTFASAPAGTTKNACTVFLSRRTVLLTRL